MQCCTKHTVDIFLHYSHMFYTRTPDLDVITSEAVVAFEAFEFRTN